MPGWLSLNHTESGPEQTTGEELIEPASSLDAGDVISDSYIVVLKDGEDSDPAAVASGLAGTLGLEVTHTYENALKGFAARVPSGLDLPAVLDDERIDFVAKDRKVEASTQTLPTGIDRVEADESSQNAGNGGGTVNADVAILDTGIYKKHSDLNISGGHSCTSGDSSAYSDGNGHGTHATGSAAAEDNGSGVVGTAPGARLLAVKVLGKDGNGTFSSVICGVDWVTKQADTIEVANISLGALVGPNADDGNCGDTNRDALHRAICGSVAKGVTYAVAAGNDSVDISTTVPAAYDEVLTVTAMSDSDGQPGSTGPPPTCRTGETDDKFANFSNYATLSSDAEHTIAAPGVCIRSTWKGSAKKRKGTYKTISGTSMASPHVAGTIALCIATNNCTGTPANDITTLRRDAENRSNLTTTPYYGFVGDPNSSQGVYYGYLEYAGGY